MCAYTSIRYCHTPVDTLFCWIHLFIAAVEWWLMIFIQCHQAIKRPPVHVITTKYQQFSIKPQNIFEIESNQFYFPQLLFVSFVIKTFSYREKVENIRNHTLRMAWMVLYFITLSQNVENHCYYTVCSAVAKDLETHTGKTLASPISVLTHWCVVTSNGVSRLDQH